jgi:GNAT superfamily N-acetyltransferase
MQLRPGEPRDLEACVQVYRAAAIPAFSWLPPEAITADYFLESIREEELWVAERGGRVEGFVSIYLPGGFIHSLYVHPAWQRQGIGRALLEQALRRCGGHGELKCQEANRAACRFYQALGWRPAGWGWSTAGAWIRYCY